MAKQERDRITSCAILWTNWNFSVATKVLQTEIQVRHYAGDRLSGGRIYPMSEQQRQELYAVLYDCLGDWDCDDYPAENDTVSWQFKICTQHRCLRTVRGTTEPPPHGDTIKKMLADIVGEDDCYFY